MASAWYPLGIKALIDGGLKLSENCKMTLINTGTTYNAAHDFYNDVSGGAVGTPIALNTEALSVAANVVKWDATDTGLTWAAVAAGSTIVAVVCYYDTGVAGTSPVLTWNEVTSTPTNGGDITITINVAGIGTITC